MDLNQALIAQGFARISVINLSTKDGVEYHVPVKHASTTKYIYHLRGKALIVSLQHEENDFCDHESSCWTIAFIWELIARRRLLAMTYDPHAPYDDFAGKYKDKPIPGFNAPLPIPTGFKELGYSGNYNLHQADYSDSATLSTEELANAVKEVTQAILPILAQDFAEPLDPDRFVPTYQWKCSKTVDVMKLFQGRFDLVYFRAIMPKPKRKGRQVWPPDPVH